MTDSTGNPMQPVPDPRYSPAQGTNPGKTFGITGLILGIVGFFVAFIAPIAGLVFSIIGRNRSKRAGQKNGVATAGIIVSIIALIANIIVVIALISIGAALGGAAIDIVEQCQSNPTGTVDFQGEQIECSDILGGTGG